MAKGAEAGISASVSVSTGRGAGVASGKGLGAGVEGASGVSSVSGRGGISVEGASFSVPAVSAVSSAASMEGPSFGASSFASANIAEHGGPISHGPEAGLVQTQSVSRGRRASREANNLPLTVMLAPVKSYMPPPPDDEETKRRMRELAMSQGRPPMDAMFPMPPISRGTAVISRGGTSRGGGKR